MLLAVKGLHFPMACFGDFFFPLQMESSMWDTLTDLDDRASTAITESVIAE